MNGSSEMTLGIPLVTPCPNEMEGSIFTTVAEIARDIYLLLVEDIPPHLPVSASSILATSSTHPAEQEELLKRVKPLKPGSRE
jgi:hypothetical protein